MFKLMKSSVAGGLLFASLQAEAGGIMIYEAGHEGTGLANAGSAVMASDPSILMTNPAGISQLAGTQINFNAQLILGDVSFSRDNANTFGGNEGGNALKYLPGSSFFISHQLKIIITRFASTSISSLV